MKSSIAILGGSFDPPHNAHMELASNVLKSGLASKVILLPTKIQPLKPSGSKVSDYHRIEMIKLLIKNGNNSNVFLSLQEIESDQVSYSYNTLKTISAYLKNNNVQKYIDEYCVNSIDGSRVNSTDETVDPKVPSISFIMGTDSFLTIEKWYKYESILTEFPIIMGNRVGYDRDLQDTAIFNYEEKYNARITVIEDNISDISSSRIRNEVSNNGNISDLVPIDIERYIYSNELYGR